MAEKIKVGYILEKKNVALVKALAKSLGVNQSEIIDCLLELTKDGIKDDMINRIADKLERRAEKLRRMANPKSPRKEG